MPFIIKFYLRYAAAGNGMGNDDGRLFIYRLGLFNGIDEYLDIMAINLNDMPVERFPFWPVKIPAA